VSGPALDDRQRLEWLRLIRSESIGPRTFRALINRFGGAGAAIEALPEIARQAGRPVRLCSAAEAEREFEALHRRGARLIALGEADYPLPLQAIDTAPPLLAVEGDLAVLSRPCVAIVGSRNASAAGLKLTATLARELGEAGFVVVSGLSLGTIVVEAARKSGSLITARFANEQGRQVFAVPGSPLDPRAEGGNHLIREGAILCAEAAHVVEVLAPMLQRRDLFEPAPFLAREDGDGPASEALWDELDLPEIAAAPRFEPRPLAFGGGEMRMDSQDRKARLLGLIGTAPIGLDDLVRASGDPAREVSRAIFELELEGVVERHAGGALSRRI